jgi:hypothetical protein
MEKKIKKQLERARERELIALYQETGDLMALEELVKSHTAYVQKVASNSEKLLNMKTWYKKAVLD